MRRSVLLALCVASLMGGASNVSANTLAWTGTMTLDLGRLGTVTQTGAGVSTLGSTDNILNTLRLAGGITVQGALKLPETAATISATSVMVTATLGTGTLRGFDTPGPLVWNALPLPGLARFCFLTLIECGGLVEVDFTETTTTGTGLGIGVGLGGIVSGMGTLATVELVGAGWQTSPAMLFTSTPPTDMATSMAMPMSMSVTMTGFVHGVISQTRLSAIPGRGLLQLITPTQVTTTGPGGVDEKIAFFTTLTIQFIPEPTRWLGALTGVAAVALLALGRRRSRERQNR